MLRTNCAHFFKPHNSLYRRCLSITQMRPTNINDKRRHTPFSRTHMLTNILSQSAHCVPHSFVSVAAARVWFPYWLISISVGRPCVRGKKLNTHKQRRRVAVTLLGSIHLCVIVSHTIKPKSSSRRLPPSTYQHMCVAGAQVNGLWGACIVCGQDRRLAGRTIVYGLKVCEWVSDGRPAHLHMIFITATSRRKVPNWISGHGVVWSAFVINKWQNSTPHPRGCGWRESVGD